MIRGIFFSQAFVENLISSWKWTYSLMWISSDSRLVESSFLAVSVTLWNEYFIYPWVWWSFKVNVYDTTQKEILLVKTNLMSHIATKYLNIWSSWKHFFQIPYLFTDVFVGQFYRKHVQSKQSDCEHQSEVHSKNYEGFHKKLFNNSWMFQLLRFHPDIGCRSSMDLWKNLW